MHHNTFFRLLTINFYVRKLAFYFCLFIFGRQGIFFYFKFLWSCYCRKIQYHKSKTIRRGGEGYNKKVTVNIYATYFLSVWKKKSKHRCFSLIFSPLFFHFYFLAVGGDVLTSRDYEGRLFVFENGSRRSLALYTFAEKDSLPLRADIFIIYVSFVLCWWELL